jgi:acyl carrier protein
MSEFYEGLAEIMEVDVSELSTDYEFGEAWDSLAVVSTIALIDEVYDKAVDIQLLQDCKTVGDIENLISKTDG